MTDKKLRIRKVRALLEYDDNHFRTSKNILLAPQELSPNKNSPSSSVACGTVFPRNIVTDMGVIFLKLINPYSPDVCLDRVWS